MRLERRATSSVVAAGIAAWLTLGAPAHAQDWPTWRGPHYNGVSDETGLVSSWSIEGENLIWRDAFVGRSTPVVLDGRVCASGRVGEDKLAQEIVACWSAETGERLWERRFIVYNTTVPFSRVGWAALEGDAETGYVFAQLVDGQFVALDAEGNTVWEHRLGEEFYRLSGYGGRTHTPLVDEDRVIISVIGMSWGEYAPPRHRYFAFDKRTGRVVWVSVPNPMRFEDANNQGTPTVGVIGGERLIVGGGADGWVHAIRSRTGEPVWRFHFGLRSVNTTPIIDGDLVYVSQSEETIDTGRMGRVVAIDGTGRGDVTDTHERWRIDEILAGFASAALHDGILYMADNSANLHAVDASRGEELWELRFGTVGKASPVWADGKIYVPQVNGELVIIEPGENAGRILDTTLIEVEGGRHAEIYGSPAIAYGRIYLATEAGIFCIGDETRRFEAKPSASPAPDRPQDPNAVPSSLQVVPGEIVIQAGESISFEARALDEQGRFLRNVEPAWSLEGLEGDLAADGGFQSAPQTGQTGKVAAKLGDLTASGRVRVAAAPPWSESFDSGEIPRHWIGAGRFKITERGEDQRLHKPPAAAGFQRGTIYIGAPSLQNYVVQADVLGIKRGRRQPDIGVINSGYSMELLGPHQQVRIQSWAAERRMAGFADFEWAPETWYTMKLIVDYEADRAIVRGRIWKKGDPEPEGWAIEVEDPLPIRSGSPGVTCDSGVDVFYDNVKVMSR